MTKNAQKPPTLQVLIIGAGFAGMGLAIKLQKAGIRDFLIVEKADEVGGTWRDNNYPGAACDVPSNLYSYSFEPKADWSRKYAPQAEIHAYQKHCADKYGLRPRIRFHTEVTGAEFDEAAGLWRVTTTTGEVLSTKALVSACGQLNRPAYPRLDGIERFEGEVFHSARWNHDYNLSGKRVAVVGTGASAIQFVPQIARDVAQLHLFQRSAAYVVGKPDRPYKAWEHKLMKYLPVVQGLSRLRTFCRLELQGLAFYRFPGLMKFIRRKFEENLQRRVPDQQKRRSLDPDYPMGCKRLLISNDYYPALSRTNVEVVSDGIREITATSVISADGREREVDAIIYGTGFTATEFLAPMSIKGRNGQELNEAWRKGAQAYLGMTVSGFPNLFILYGPNTNLGHNSIIHMLESQFRYVLGCIRTLTVQGLRYLEVKPQVQRDFNLDLQKQSRGTVFDQACTSWYKTADGINTANWPASASAYRKRTQRLELEDFECVR